MWHIHVLFLYSMLVVMSYALRACEDRRHQSIIRVKRLGGGRRERVGGVVALGETRVGLSAW